MAKFYTSFFLLLHFGSWFAVVNSFELRKIIMFSNDYAKDLSLSVESGTSSENMKMDRMGSPGDVKKPQSAILPICCHMEMEEVMFFQCGNSLDFDGRRTSWKAPAHLVSTDVETKFRLEKSFLSCRSTNITTYIYINESYTEANHFSPDGYLRYDEEYYRPDEYCINGFNDKMLELIICKANCSDPQTPCINKCCGLNEIYSLGYGDNPRGCVTLEPEDTKWYPKLYHDMDVPLAPYEMDTINPHIVQNFPTTFKFNCFTNKTTVFPHGEQVAQYLSTLANQPYLNLQFRVRRDGALVYTQRTPNGTWVPVTSKLDNYCVDGVQDYGELTDFSNAESETILFLCSGDSAELTSGNINTHNELSGKKKPSASASTTKSKQKGNGKRKTKPKTKKKQQDTQVQAQATNNITKTTTTDENSNDRKLLEQQNLISIPTCCHMGPDVDVNDGTTHHCKGRISNVDETSLLEKQRLRSVWNVPPFFMTSSEHKNFTLQKNPIVCKSGRFQFQGFIHNFGRRRNKLGDSKKYGILPDGHLKYESEFYRPDEYCINGLSPRILEVLICKPYCSSSETPCIQKCCGINEIYSLGLPSPRNPDTAPARGCQPLNSDDTPWKPRLFYDMNSHISSSELNRIKPHVIQKYPPAFQHNCYQNITLAFPFSREVAIKLSPQQEDANGTFKHLQFRVRKDGKLMYTYPDGEGSTYTSIMDSSDYCIDGIRNYGESRAFTNQERQTILFICAMNQPPTQMPMMQQPPEGQEFNLPVSPDPQESKETHTVAPETEVTNGELKKESQT